MPCHAMLQEWNGIPWHRKVQWPRGLWDIPSWCAWHIAKGWGVPDNSVPGTPTALGKWHFPNKHLGRAPRVLVAFAQSMLGCRFSSVRRRAHVRCGRLFRVWRWAGRTTVGRPETVEALFYLWRATKDPHLPRGDWGWQDLARF